MNAYTDWQRNFDYIENKQDKTILELGCGVGTKYLLDNFKKVYSYEVTPTDKWYQKTKEDYKNYTNWESIFYYSKYLQEYDNEIKSSRGRIRNSKPLKRYFQQLHGFVNIHEIDIVFVDQGNHFRAESAEYFMSWGVPMVIIHDSKSWPHSTDEMYGYQNIKPHQYNYWYDSFTKGQGTVFFYNKDYYPRK